MAKREERWTIIGSGKEEKKGESWRKKTGNGWMGPRRQREHERETATGDWSLN